MRVQAIVSGISVGATSLVIGTALWAADPTGATGPIADVTKVSVERPVAAVVKNASLVVEQPAPAAVERPSLNNPKVKPGEVCWHSTVAEACEASGRTHKPVLLFQLLGKLDHQFC